MKTHAFIAFVICGLVSVLRAAEPEKDGRQPVASRISEAVVFADRAQVTRFGTADISTDPIRVAFTKLPGWIDEGSVRVSLVPADAAQILDVQVERTFLARASDEEFQKAEIAVRDISDQIATLDDEKTVLDAQSKQVESIRAFALDRLPRETALREIKVDEYGQSVEFITSSLRKVAAARRELEKNRRDLQPELTARQRRLDDLRQRAQLEQRNVIVTLKGHTARNVTLSLTYMLPGATWEPVHELRTALDTKTVSLASYAVVMQTTGEDWSDVKLSLSTQQSTATMKIPELEAFLVGSGRKLPKFVGGARDTFAEGNRIWESQNSVFNNLGRGLAVLEEYRVNQAVQIDNARRVERVFETLQQRGTTAHFPAAGSQIIRSDGRPVRVPIGRVELSAQHRIIAAPEASLNAARTAELNNTGSQALLPGRVSLFMDGAFLGMTESEFVAPGESFAMFLGVADQVKLSRILDKKRSELVRSGSKTKMKVSFLVTVENLTDRETAMQLNDRVPVSESEDIRVSSVKIQPEGKPDAKGLLRWDLALGPKQTREFHIDYTLEYPNNALTSAAGRAGEKGMTPIPGRATFEGKSSVPLDSLREQIRELEKRF